MIIYSYTMKPDTKPDAILHRRPAQMTKPRASAIARTFKALADPTRVRLVGALLDGEHCVHDLCVQVELEQSAVSHQLRVLRDQQLVRSRKDGRHVYYSLDDAHIRELLEIALAHVRHGKRGAGR